MGSPYFAVPSLERLVLNGCGVVAVYTQPDKPAGRGRALVSPPVKEAARRLGLPVVQPENLKTEESFEILAALKPDVIVVAAFGQILPPTVLEMPGYGCLNVHASLLPRHRGASPVAAVLLAGDRFTGVSIMLMEKRLDAGPVLARAAIPVSLRDNAGSLTEKLSLVGASLLLEALNGWIRRETVPRPQNEAEATYCVSVRREDGNIDWGQPVLDIWRRVRAYNPWPGCYTAWRGRQLKILEAVPVAVEGLSPGGAAGRVVALHRGDAAFGVCAGDGVLGVLRIQLEGKKAMAAAEFLRGQPAFIGAVLPC
jgi:methionyl-tRNA formyltransferase